MMKKVFMGILVVVMCFWAFSVMSLPITPVARLGFGWITNVTFSPDGRILAVASESGLYLYDTVNLVQVYYFLTYPKQCVAFSPDGKLLASGGMDNTIKLWNVESRKEVATLEGRNVNSVAFSPDGKLWLAGVGIGMVQLSSGMW